MDNTNKWISNIPLHFGAINRVFSQPCRQCPSDWWHAGEVMLQFPQVEVQCCPKYPTEHSGKEIFRLNLNVFQYFPWVFLISRHCFSTVRNKPNSIYNLCRNRLSIVRYIRYHIVQLNYCKVSHLYNDLHIIHSVRLQGTSHYCKLYY